MGLGGLGYMGMFDPDEDRDQGLSNALSAPSVDPYSLLGYQNSLKARELLLGAEHYTLSTQSLLPAPSYDMSLSMLSTEPTSNRSSIHQAFCACLSNIELDATRSSEASQHYNAVKDLLEKRIPGVEIRRVGSFQRHTKIRPRVENGVASPIDIDALVCFGDALQLVSYGGATADGALDIVRNALISNKVYRLLAPQIDHPTVTLSYGNEFSIELIPCYRNRLSTVDKCRKPASFLVTNSAGAWEHADYDYDSDYITSANQNADGKLIPAIKLIKQFVRNRSIGLKSFQVELLCVKILVPYIQARMVLNVKWEWQELFAHFLAQVGQILTEDLSLPGSRTRAPVILNASSVANSLSLWGKLVSLLAECPDTTSTLLAYKEVYGDRFPSP